MLRRLALSASLLLAFALSAPAQIQHHTVTHQPPDSAHHAVLHALMSGLWSGSFGSPHGDSSGMSITLAHDDTLRRMSFTLAIDPPFVAGPSTDLSISALRLRWTQDLSGNSCEATAVVTPATSDAPDTMKGRITCEHGALDFTLYKKPG
jgi:hypothetical protein